MPRKTFRKSAKTASNRVPAKPKLLSGVNPQIPKGDGDAPVRAYIFGNAGLERAGWTRAGRASRAYRAERTKGG